MLKSAILLLAVTLTIISVQGTKTKKPGLLKTSANTAPEEAQFTLKGSVDDQNQQFGMWLQNDSLQSFYYLSLVNDQYYTGHVQGVKKDYEIQLIAKAPDAQQRIIGVGINEFYQIVGAFSLDAQNSNGLRVGRADCNFSKPKTIYYVDLHSSGDGVAFTVDKNSRRDFFGSVKTEQVDPSLSLIKMTVTPLYQVGGKHVIRCVQIFKGYEYSPLTLSGQEDCSKGSASGGGSFYLSLEEAPQNTPGFTTYKVTQLDDYSGLSKQDKQTFMNDYISSFYQPPPDDSNDDGYDDGSYDDY